MDNTHQLEKPWSDGEKIGFRFVFIFFILFIVFKNNGAFPFFNFIMEYPTAWAHQFIPWIGKYMLRLPYDITVFRSGSGDTTYDYVLLFSCFLIAVFGTIFWSVLDRGRSNYRTLFYYLTVVVRFYVAFMLIGYGLIKIFKLQFPAPGLFRLLQPYGYSSPMGLAWTFLGFSKGYNFFMGIAELAAALLLFRRTVVLGAIITLMTTANIMAVNYFYDVPVKILSTALFVMTLFLLLPDAKRLIKFFFSGEAVSLPVMPLPAIDRKWLYTAGTVFKFILVGFVVIPGVYQSMQMEKQYGDDIAETSLYEIYNVETFVFDGDTLPPLPTNDIRWRQLTFDRRRFAQVRFMNDSVQGLKADTISKIIQLQGPGQYGSFYYKFKDPKHLLLTGNINNIPTSILFTVDKDLKIFKLTGRGFHWINEYPYNH